MSGMYGYGPYGSMTYTTNAPQAQQGGGLLGGIPGGGSIPGMLMNGSSLLGGSGAGAGGLGGGSMAGPMFWAALIGLGKNLENSNPRTAFGQGLLAGLGPSGNQILKDPVGMGLPTLFGMPFLTPFTSSKEAQAARPEWQSLFKLGT